MNQKILITVILVLAVAFVAVLSFSSSPSTGFVKLETPDAKLLLRGGFWSKQNAISGTTPVQLKTGTYGPRQINISKKSGNDTWRINGHGSWGKLKSIKVSKDETMNIQVGPPLTLKADVSRRGPNVSIGLSIVGISGEHYQPQVHKNGRKLYAPSLKIFDESEKVLVDAKFKYG